MKKVLAITAAFLVFVFISPQCYAQDVGFILGANVGNWLYSPKGSDLEGTQSNERSWQMLGFEGASSWTPTINMGVGIDTKTGYLDITGCAGYFWNNAFDTTMYGADVAYRFKVGDNMTIGPHVGVLFFNAPSVGIAKEVRFDSTTGYNPGIAFSIGQKLAFDIHVDYLYASFDIKDAGGWTFNNNSLDMSGMLIQLGFLYRM